jgi:hypothetical protein
MQMDGGSSTRYDMIKEAKLSLSYRQTSSSMRLISDDSYRRLRKECGEKDRKRVGDISCEKTILSTTGRMMEKLRAHN